MFGVVCYFILIAGFMVANLSTLWLGCVVFGGLGLVFVGYFVVDCGWVWLCVFALLCCVCDVWWA